MGQIVSGGLRSPGMNHRPARCVFRTAGFFQDCAAVNGFEQGQGGVVVERVFDFKVESVRWEGENSDRLLVEPGFEKFAVVKSKAEALDVVSGVKFIDGFDGNFDGEGAGNGVCLVFGLWLKCDDCALLAKPDFGNRIRTDGLGGGADLFDQAVGVFDLFVNLDFGFGDGDFAEIEGGLIRRQGEFTLPVEFSPAPASERITT